MTARLEGVHLVIRVVAVIQPTIVDETNRDTQAHGEGPHEAFEIGDRRREERVRQRDLLQDETARYGELGLRGRQVRSEELEVHGREAGEGQAEGEGQDHLESEVAGQVGRPDEGEREGTGAKLGDDIDGGDGLPTRVLSRREKILTFESMKDKETEKANLIWARGYFFNGEYRVGVTFYDEGNYRP